MAAKRPKETELYDYTSAAKEVLRYVNRRASVPDPGVLRTLSPKGTEGDPLCMLWYGNLLTGQALEDAPRVCPVKPDGWITPARFYKSLNERD